LKRADQTEPRDVGGLHCSYVVALEQNASARWAQELGQQVEAGGLASAVGPDQSVDGPALDAQAHAVNGDKAGKLLRQILGFEDYLFTHRQQPLVAHS